MLNFRPRPVEVSPTTEAAIPAVIVSNFNMGLMRVCSTIEPVAPPEPVAPSVIVRKQIRAPRLAQLPAASSRRRELLLSALLHTSILALVVNLPILFPAWTVTAMDAADANLRREADFEPLFLPVLPPIAATKPGPEVKTKPGPGDVVHHTGITLSAARPRVPTHPKLDYAGAQLIVSNPPHSPKGVQTIRRPDLITPPKLAFPLRLPSMVMIPVPAIPAPTAPRQLQSVRPNAKAPRTVRASEPTLQLQPPTVEMPKLAVAPAEPAAPPKVVAASQASSPRFAAAVRPEIPAPKAVVVINAVNVPPGSLPVIPEAELSSRFVVGPSRDSAAVETASGATGGNLAGAGALKAGENLSGTSVENGTGTKTEAGLGHANVASTESSLSVGARSGSGAGTPSTTAAGNNGLPGISISGGVPGRSGRAVAASTIPRGSYALTIISGGSSGGASRDLGVFARTDTVYTVYIPMADVGGGPDWPMQYTLMGPAQAHNGLPNGLLTPPVVLKKIQATAPKIELIANSGPVFVTGIIDENGKLQALRAIRALDGRAQSAVNALSQWGFLPAQLDGKPVASKVLIGVSVMAAEEVRKQN